MIFVISTTQSVSLAPRRAETHHRTGSRPDIMLERGDAAGQLRNTGATAVCM